MAEPADGRALGVTGLGVTGIDRGSGGLVPRAEGADRHFGLGLGLVLLATLAFRLSFASHYPLSMDEAFARYWSELPQGFLWGEGRRVELNPPLYFSVLAAWTGVFGFSDVALRFPSALASVSVVALAGALGRRVLGGTGGLVAAAFCALLPCLAWFGLDARPAAFAMLFQAAALWAAFVALDNDGAGGRTRRARLWPALAFTLAAILAVHTHATGMFFVAALGTTVAATLALRGRAAFPDLALWIGAGAAVVLLCLPQVMIFAAQSRDMELAHLVPAAGLAGWRWLVQSFVAPLLLGAGVFELETPLRLALLGLLGGAVLAGAGRIQGGAGRAILIGFPLLLIGALAAASLSRPVLTARAALILLAPVSVLLAAAVLTVSGLAWRALVALLLAAPLLLGQVLQWSNPATMGVAIGLRHEYRAVVRFLATGECRGDIFAGHPWNLWGWPHYGPPPAGSRLFGVRYPDEEDIYTDYALSRFAPRHGTTFIDRAEFLQRAETDEALIVLIGRTARARAAMESDIAALSARFLVARHDFGVGNNLISVHCLMRRGN